jgi:hypothetical protein
MKPQFNSLDSKVTLENGIEVSVRVEYDDTIRAPWKEYDGHGIVSEWRPYSEHYRGGDSKEPGERVLVTDRGSALFYDVQASTKKALEEDWGCGIDSHDHKTKGERAACAVQEDFDNLRRFAEGQWHYVGIVLDLERDGWTRASAASVWGIEDNDRANMLAVANELLDEVRAEHGDAPTCEHAEGEDCMNCVDCGRCREDLDCQDRCGECGGHDCETTHPESDEVDA